MTRFLSVSEITNQIKATLSLYHSKVYIEGEIGTLTLHQSGHCYFTLKDSEASIKCVLFKNTKCNLTLQTSMNIQVEGTISVYASRGEYQVICSNITQSGIGNLALQYEKLKTSLKEKGYFDEKHKKQLPKFPRKIAFITSLSGAALQDMKFVAQKRWNLIEITIFDTLVQGMEAKYKIVERIREADSGKFDVIVLARGGGSLEDLWAFNEEIVVEAIFQAKTPIISAIGHEIDFTLSDFVSDMRAPTPSSSMEILLPDKVEWLQRLSDYLEHIHKIQDNTLGHFGLLLQSLREKIESYKIDYHKINAEILLLKKAMQRNKDNLISFKLASIGNLKNTLTSKCQHSLYFKTQNLSHLSQRLRDSMLVFLQSKMILQPQHSQINTAMRNYLESQTNRLNHLNNLLASYNPKNRCDKGFAQITQNHTIKSLDELKSDDIITLSDGKCVREAKIL